jgi:F0F1-type ATP synthase membrane subunit b/b'
MCGARSTIVSRGAEMVDAELTYLIIGICLGLVASIIGAILNHALPLRADEIKRERDRAERERTELRQQLAQPAEVRYRLRWSKQ